MYQPNRSDYRPRRHHHRSMFDFARKPAFQIGVVIFVGLLVLTLALFGQKPGSKTQNLLPTAAAGQPTGTAIANVISVNDAYALYMSSSAYLLDVRERSEWDQVHIPGSTLLPLGQVSALVSQFPKDKPIIILSGSDNRSQQARDILRQAGFANATSMAGGIAYWRSQGYPVEP